MTKTNKGVKAAKKASPLYVSIEALDSLLKGRADPIAMMAEMKKLVIEHAMEAELNQHLTHSKHDKSIDGNYCNGHGSKTVIMNNGSLEIMTPRDRDGSFKPQLIPKRQHHFKGFDQ